MTAAHITIFACDNSTPDYAIILGDKIGRYADKSAADAVWSKAVDCELFGAMQYLEPNYKCCDCHHVNHTDILDFAACDLDQVIDDEQAAFNARMAADVASRSAAAEIDWV